MNYSKIEIIPIIKFGSYTTKYNNKFNFNKLFKNSQIKSTTQCKILIYKDLHLIIGDDKNVYKVKQINSKLIDNVVYIKQLYESIPIENFPFIDKYDSVIMRTQIQYSDEIKLITDTYLNNDERITFIGIDSDEQLESMLKLIKEIS